MNELPQHEPTARSRKRLRRDRRTARSRSVSASVASPCRRTRRPTVATVTVPATAAAVNRALEQLAPADVIVLSEPCRVTPGWLERMRDAARGGLEHGDRQRARGRRAPSSRCASEDAPGGGLRAAGRQPRRHTLTLRPRLSRAVGPCVYVRREALELVGPLDEELDLRWALEVDFAQRCLLSGLAHVAADDVVVQRLAPAHAHGRDEASCRRCWPSAIHTCQTAPRSPTRASSRLPWRRRGGLARGCG